MAPLTTAARALEPGGPAGPPRAQPGPRLAVEVARSERELEALLPEWRALVEGGPAPSPFQTPEWLLPWWRRFASGEPRQLFALAARRGGALCALAPLVIETERPAGVPIRVLRFLGHTMSDFQDFALAGGEPRAAVAALVRELARSDDWDVLDLREFDPRSAALTPLLEGLRSEGWDARELPDSRCHFAPIEGSWDEFYRSRWSRHHRKDHRREWRRLEERGAIRARLDASPLLAGEWLEPLAELERCHPAAERGRPGGFNTEPARSFLAEALPALDRRGWLLHASLHCGEALIAHYLGFRLGGAHYLYATAYREEFREVGAGKLLLLHTLAALWESGGERIELLRGEQPFKQLWAPSARHNARVVAVRRSPAARARGWAWFVGLPALERRAPQLRRALDVAGREGWGAALGRGARALGRRAARGPRT